MSYPKNTVLVFDPKLGIYVELSSRRLSREGRPKFSTVSQAAQAAQRVNSRAYIVGVRDKITGRFVT